MPTGKQVFDNTLYGSSGGGGGGVGGVTVMGGPSQIASALHLNKRNKGRNKGRGNKRGRRK